MSDRTAELLQRGIGRYNSAKEAWKALKESREEIDWNPEKVRRE